MSDIETIQDGKEFLRTHANKGTECPCCGQFVKFYARKFNSAMARSLIAMVQYHIQQTIRMEHGNDGWIYAQDVMRYYREMSGDYAKMRFWGLIEARPKDSDSDQRTSGYWRLTKHGEDFVRGRIRIPSHAIVFDDKLLHLESRKGTLSISDALGRPFSFRELMRE